MIKELALKNRSYRRFYQEERLSEQTLLELIDCARVTPSTVNSQALKFKPVVCEELCSEVFECLGWAGMLKDWNGPEDGERPCAYIVILCDLSLGKNKHYDEGIAAQTIMLAAAEMGYGGCIIGSIDKERLAEKLKTDPGRYSIDLVLALGKPKETVVLTEMGIDGSTAYYRDENGIHYVPKRRLKDIVL